MVGQHLDAPFRHHAGCDARNGEGRRVWAGRGLDWTRHPDQVANGEIIRGEAAVCSFRVRHGESREMHSGVAFERRIELTGQRRIGCLEQNLAIAASEHDGDVAGSGRTRAAGGIRADLDGNRRRRKSATRQRAARGLGIAHEMGDVIEEYFFARRKLAVDLVTWG